MNLTVGNIISIIKGNEKSIKHGIKYNVYSADGAGGLIISDLTETTVTLFPASQIVHNGKRWLSNYSNSPRFQRSKIVCGGGFSWRDIDSEETKKRIKTLINRAKKHQSLGA